MKKYDEIVGMPVLSTMEGKDLGKLSEMAIDLKNSQVVGFLIEDKKGRKMFLPIGNVDTYGKDVVMASSESDMKKMDDLAGKAEAIELAEKIIGLKIITEQGEAVGEIASFCFDEKSGLITHYVTSKGVLGDFMDGKGLLPREGVCAFSLDALVVAQRSVEISDIMKVAPGMKQKINAVVYETEIKAKAAIRKVEKIVNT